MERLYFHDYVYITYIDTPLSIQLLSILSNACSFYLFPLSSECSLDFCIDI